VQNDSDPAGGQTRPQPRYARLQAKPPTLDSESDGVTPAPSLAERLTNPGVTMRERRELMNGGLDPLAARQLEMKLKTAETQAGRLTRLLKLSQRLSSILDHETLLDAILDEVIPLANAQQALILLDQEPGGLEIVRGRTAQGESVPNDLSKISGTLARSCISENRVQVYDDLANRPELRQVRSIVLNDLYSAICLPLRDKGTAFGVLYLDSSLPTMAHAAGELDILEGFAAHASICLINAKLIKRLEHSREILVRENQDLRATVQGGWRFAGMIGKTASMQQLFDRLRLIKDVDIAVLLKGESGTGKELVARALHSEGHRAKRPFVAVNCAAIPPQLFESEFFGHRKGGFTGAIRDHAGVVEQAEGGTLFLDEIGDMPIEFQPKLLRFLEGGEYRPVGATEVQYAHVRVISATNLDLNALIQEKRFRQELLFRLEGVRVEIPSLRNRREDIPLLIDHYFRKTVEKHPRKIHGISEGALQAMLNFPWPGNIRQLIRAIEGSCALVPDGGWLDIPQLEMHMPELTGSGREAIAGIFVEEETLHDTLQRAEKLRLDRTLSVLDWNITKTAHRLGISRQHLHNRIRVHGLQRPRG
jgi:two-component system response regulator HydG